jgi:flap endonuclease-1
LGRIGGLGRHPSRCKLNVFSCWRIKLTHQGPLLKNLSLARQPLIALPPSDLLSLISLTRAQLIDFCILLGNDACPRIPGIGAVAGYKQIVKHGSIEAILENEKKVRDKVPDMQEYMELVRGARTVFGDLPPISEEVKGELDTTFAGMKGQELDLEGVERWMEERHGIRFVSPDGEYMSDGAP